ncbi:MAG: hypothetical protein ACI4WM_05445, partial [Erysipelotrichaceae bacterium]
IDGGIKEYDIEFNLYHTDITRLTLYTKIDQGHSQRFAMARDGRVYLNEKTPEGKRTHKTRNGADVYFRVIDMFEKNILIKDKETVQDDNYSVTVEYETTKGNKHRRQFNLSNNYKTLSDYIRRYVPLYNLYLLDGQNFKEPALFMDDICFIYQIIPLDETVEMEFSAFMNYQYTYTDMFNKFPIDEKDFKEIAGIVYNDIYALGDLNKDIEENSPYIMDDPYNVRMVFNFDKKETVVEGKSLLDYWAATEKMTRFSNALSAINLILKKYGVELTEVVV